MKEGRLSAIRSRIDYNPETGAFTRLRNKPRPGRTKRDVGTVDRWGRVFLSVGGEKYSAHRLGWAIHYGEWPPGQMAEGAQAVWGQFARAQQ